MLNSLCTSYLINFQCNNEDIKEMISDLIPSDGYEQDIILSLPIELSFSAYHAIAERFDRQFMISEQSLSRCVYPEDSFMIDDFVQSVEVGFVPSQSERDQIKSFYESVDKKWLADKF